jgi:hypothetical protein
MKTKRTVQALIREQAGKDAVIILNKIDRMLKQGVARTKIEKVVAAELLVYMKKQNRIICPRIIFPPIRP